MEIGMKIRQLRREKNLTAEELASKIGLTGSAIYSYEKGKAVPPIEKLKELAQIFGKDLSFFISENTENRTLGISDWKGEAYRKLEIENAKLWALVEKLTGAQVSNFPLLLDQSPEILMRIAA